MKSLDLFESQEHRNNFAHFSALAYIAGIHGKIEERELILLTRLANKLQINT